MKAHLVGLLWVLGVCCCAGLVFGQQQPWLPTSETHSWARFGRGAWKTVRVRNESFDEEGNVVQTSTTDSRIRLQRATRHSISLCITSTLEVAGSEIAAKPKTLTQQLGETVERVETLPSETLRIGGQDYVVAVVRLIGTSDKLKRTSTVYYNTGQVPHILKRVTVARDSTTGDVVSETTVTVTGLGERRAILGEFKSTWSVNTVEKRGDVTVLTREVQCRDVPGELVSRVTEERDAEGRMVRRSSLELLGYGYGRRRLFGHRR